MYIHDGKAFTSETLPSCLQLSLLSHTSMEAVWAPISQGRTLFLYVLRVEELPDWLVK